MSERLFTEQQVAILGYYQVTPEAVTRVMLRGWPDQEGSRPYYRINYRTVQGLAATINVKAEYWDGHAVLPVDEEA